MRSVFRAAGGLFVLGMLVPATSVAEQGWAPVVTKASKAESLLFETPVPTDPPLPHPKRRGLRKQPDAVASEKAVAVPAPAQLPPALLPSNVSEITTGSIEAVEPTRVLSPADSVRLFAEEGNPPSQEWTTGAINNQGSDLARGYCVNIAGAAADARTALQRAKLAEVERQIGYRITALEAKTAEYKAWVERRDEFLKRATSALVKIYTQMEPDAAASQLVSLDEETAAALLINVEPQTASAILNEMPPDKAARLTATIAGSARVPKSNAVPAGAPAARPSGDAPERANPSEGRS